MVFNMRVGIVTLGCDKNTVDNEYLAGLLRESGCEPVAVGEHLPEEPIDAVVVTTCAFIAAAREQSVDVIVRLAENKRRTGHPGRLYVAGCLSQGFSTELMDAVEEIDGMVGVGQQQELVDMIVAGDGSDRRMNVHGEPRVEVLRRLPRQRLTGHRFGFLKIADGCNHTCSFCAIPRLKGPYRSVDPDILLDEARQMLSEGIREINLVAQDVAAYGVDRWSAYRLSDLLQSLCGLSGTFWIRLLYCYPGGLSDRLLRMIREEPKIVPYLDVPLQHLDDRVLRRMRRPAARMRADRLVKRLRAAIPELTLRTTMVIGFPGETEAEFQRLLEGVRALRFERLGAFMYSREPETAAASEADQVAPDVKRRRWHRLMEEQARVATQWACGRIGTRPWVLIEGREPNGTRWMGRSPAEAPEVDAYVYIQSEHELEAGMFVQVEILAVEDDDLVGRVL